MMLSGFAACGAHGCVRIESGLNAARIAETIIMSKSPFLKRLLDLGLAIPMAVIAAPLCVVLLLVVALESPGAPLFVQQRVGRNQRPFAMYKIRTMHLGTPQAASHETAASSVTRIGVLLRRLKLDELPQLVNVLKGEMSYVGPRPCLPSQTVLVQEREARGLFALRPGITGPAQLMGIDMSTPERLAEVEVLYFGHSTIFDDIRVILRTFTGGGCGDAALRLDERP